VNHASRQSGNCPILTALLIEFAAGTLDRSVVGLSPRPEHMQGHDQRFSALGQFIIHPGRIGRVNRSRDEAIALQALQRQRQHALRDTLDQLEDLAVTHRSMREHADHHHGPLVADARQYVRERAVVLAGVALCVPETLSVLMT
jgi:hypothetical protein